MEVEDINCIAVDWEEGAKCTYFSAASNIRVLGAEITYLINTFMVRMVLSYVSCQTAQHSELDAMKV